MPYKDKKKQSEYQVCRMKRRRTKWLNEHGPCVYCGSKEDLLPHHKNPDLKVSHRIWSWSDERLETELEKCVIVCAPCHRIYHNPEQHGTPARYKKSCRCLDCKVAKSIDSKRWPKKSLLSTDQDTWLKHFPE